MTAAILWLCLPVVQRQDTVLMAEIPVALLAYLSVIGLTRFFENPCWRWAFTFALFAALAALTKGNGLALFLVPLIAAPLCRRILLLFRLEFVVACVTAAMVVGLWYIPTRHLINGTFQELSGFAFAKAAAAPNLRFLFESIGGGAFLFSAAGFWAQVGRKLSPGVAPRWAVAAAFILSVLIFHTFVNASIADRHLITAIPPLLESMTAGIACCADMQRYVAPRFAAGALALLVLAQFFVLDFQLPHFAHYGFRPIAQYIEDTPALWPGAILVSSERRRGEAVFVAEMVAGRQQPDGAVVRASKVLAEATWLDQRYRLIYQEPSAIEAYLESVPIDAIVLDRTAAEQTYPHHRLLLATILAHPRIWALDRTFRGPSGAGRIEIYRRIAPTARSVKHLTISLPFTLGRAIQLNP
jgi:hypothetical protein